MRRILSFKCEGAECIATLDEAAGSAGLLIVSGGNEIRIGAHRGMAKLAAVIAGAGHPVFRFDRRGIGDSEGENGGFESSAPDIAAALAAFRAECPQLTRIVGFGNCDAASALAMHGVPGIDALVLANPWVIERQDELPPPAAIRARYAERLRDPAAWRALLGGRIDLRKLIGGIRRVVAPQALSGLSYRVASGMNGFTGPISIIAAERDATAIAFLDKWGKPQFEAVRGKARLERLASGSHSFAGEEDFAALTSHLLNALRG